MDYYGLLFLYYLKGLSGKSILRLFFNIEAGGTEQLLPENTSTPTTTPILADIQYPDGLRTDQYFTYRETPTTVSNKARIKTIKGNTIVWNQLALITNNNSIVQDGVTLTRNTTTGLITLNGTATADSTFNSVGFISTSGTVVGHKYLIQGSKANAEIRYPYSSARDTGNGAIVTFSQTSSQFRVLVTNGTTFNNLTLNPQIFDLTLMFGAGNEPTSVAEFTKLFSLPYYEYNAGSLLSFNGTGLKIIGFNLAERWSSGNTSAGYANAMGVECELLPNTSYCVSFIGNSGNRIYPNENLFTNTARITCNGSRQFVVLTTFANISKATTSQYQSSFGWRIFKNDGGNTVNSVFSDVCVNFNNSSRNGEYEPYTESNLSLPVSQYFPNGMKSAGNVYDELTDGKAITRIGAVDLGTLDWTDRSSVATGLFSATDNTISYAFKQSVKAVCAKYPYYGTVVSAAQASGMSDKTIALYYNMTGSNHVIYLLDTSYSDVASLKSALSGVYLYYELATETETPITTEDANEALSLLMGKSVSSSNANQMINIITKGE